MRGVSHHQGLAEAPYVGRALKLHLGKRNPFCSAFRPGVLSSHFSLRARTTCSHYYPRPDRNRDNLTRAHYLHLAL